MKRPAMPFLLALLSASVAVPGCGAFNACVKPVASQITWTGTATELGEVIATFLMCDPGFIGPEVPACAVQAIDDLASSIGPGGVKAVDCIIAYYQTNGAAALQQRARAVGAKRGINVSALSCQRYHLAAFSPGDATPKTGPAVREHVAGSTPAGWPTTGSKSKGLDSPNLARVAPGPYFYPGENPGAALERCDRTCGEHLTSLATVKGCLCWRGKGRAGHWVALREAPGLGLVATR